MSKVAGADVLLKVSDESGTLQVVGGQTNATLNREANTIDTSDKTTGGFATSIAGLISWSVDAEGFVVLGGEALTMIEDAFTSRSEISLEIRVGADDNADGRTYTGKGYIVDFPLEMAMDDAVTFSISVTGSTALEKVVGTADGSGV